MTPAAIIQQARNAGVFLSLSPSGTIKATGDSEAVQQWLPAIRDNKPGIIKELLEASALGGELAAVRRWLDFIGECDPRIIGEILDKCRTDPEALEYFNQRATGRL